MSTVKIAIGEFEQVLGKTLNDYSDTVLKETRTLVKKVANQAKKDTQAGAPKKTGAYAKDWAVKDTSYSVMSAGATLYNRSHYQLTHLLEKGHAKRNGGRVEARVHIQPAEEQAIKNFEKGLKEIAQGRTGL